MADETKDPSQSPAAADASQAAPEGALSVPVLAPRTLDSTVPGGAYRTVSGDWVDAEGRPIPAPR